MKSVKKTISKILLSSLLVGTIAGTLLVPACRVSKRADYTLHEWGVMEGCFKSDEGFITSRPYIEVLVKQPVITIHSDREIRDLDLQITIPQITDPELTDTYPQADVHENLIKWNDVRVTESREPIVPSKFAARERTTIEDLIPVLNNVDSNTMVYKDEKTKFLFYEAAMKFENMVELEFDLNGMRVKNKADYPVYSVMFNLLVQGENFLENRVVGAFVNELKPGEEREVKLEEFSRLEELLVGKNKKEFLVRDMMELGFSELEILRFVELWEYNFFIPTNIAFRSEEGPKAIFSYRLPEEQYNKMLLLKASPKPKDVERMMYVLLDAKTQLKVDYKETDAEAFFTDMEGSYRTLPKEKIREYAYGLLPEEAKELLLKSNLDDWKIGIDPHYSSSDIACEACGWMCYTTPTPYEWKITEREQFRSKVLEIRIRNVQCYGLVPAFYYNGMEYLPELPMPTPEGP